MYPVIGQVPSRFHLPGAVGISSDVKETGGNASVPPEGGRAGLQDPNGQREGAFSKALEHGIRYVFAVSGYNRTTYFGGKFGWPAGNGLYAGAVLHDGDALKAVGGSSGALKVKAVGGIEAVGSNKEGEAFKQVESMAQGKERDSLVLKAPVFDHCLEPVSGGFVPC